MLLINYVFKRVFQWTFFLYSRAEKSPEAKEQFLRQLENIDVGVKQALDRVSVSTRFIIRQRIR